MLHKFESVLDWLVEHCITVCLVLAVCILSVVGAGEIRIICLLGLLLCAVGLVQRSAQVDLWVLSPMIVFELASAASAFAAYHNITDGYTILQLIFPVLYLLAACLEPPELQFLKRLCAIWTGTAAAASIAQFVWRAAALGSAARLSGLLGNPNAMGFYLVAGWFLLLHCSANADGLWCRLLPCLEPLLLCALALTLSMGSFVAMAAGILVILIAEKQRTSWKNTFTCACRLLAKASLGVGTGVLLYLGASHTGAPWICLPIAMYTVLAACCWLEFDRFLGAYPKIAAVLAGMGAAVAVTVILVRPSSIATFAERLEMMANGLHYLTKNPLLGVGPFRWRVLNLYDSDTYFNTWHIHNVLLHIGVEFGWIAMAMLVIIMVRAFRKHKDVLTIAGLCAFCVHNMIDTSFFYVGITALVLLAAGLPRTGGRTIRGPGLRVLFGVCAGLFIWGLYHSIAAG